MTEIQYTQGDATCPQGPGARVIAHVCNDMGRWGKGFVMAISARWPEPEKAYRQWHADRSQNDFGLGAVQLVCVQESLWIANMVGQHGLRGDNRVPPIRYGALEECLGNLSQKVWDLDARVHMPRIGCGLAGGKWEQIKPLVIKTLCEKGISVTVYDF